MALLWRFSRCFFSRSVLFFFKGQLFYMDCDQVWTVTLFVSHPPLTDVGKVWQRYCLHNVQFTLYTHVSAMYMYKLLKCILCIVDLYIYLLSIDAHGFLS